MTRLLIQAFTEEGLLYQLLHGKRTAGAVRDRAHVLEDDS